MSDPSFKNPFLGGGDSDSDSDGENQYGGKRRGRGRKGTRRAGNPWTDLVKKVFNQNKHKSGYKFKDALMDAKKVYRGSVVEPNRVGTRAAKNVATSIAHTVGKFADNAVSRRRRGTRGRGRKGRR